MRALGRNHELWSILVRDLALGGNGLPEAIKAQLIQLGTWSMQYSTRALLQPLDLHPLIEVNRNIADGLAAQRAKPDGVTPSPRTAPQQHGRLEISGA